MDAARRINDLAAQQHAAFTRRQALQAGMSDTTLSRRVREGRYSRRLRGTFAIPGAPLTWHH